jgi:hypothetical protein
MKSPILFGATALFAGFFATAAAIAPNAVAQERGTEAAATTVTGATGTITQVNYGENGEVEAFLVGTNVLLSFPSNVCGGLSTLGVVGNSVTYSGTAVAATSGFQSVRVSSFTNNTTKAVFTAPASTAIAFGPTSGAIKQLNYTGGGVIDGFVFTPSGSTAPIFVTTGARASTTLAPLLTVGATASVTGTTSARLSACSASGTLESVEASSLTIAGQTIAIAGGGRGRVIITNGDRQKTSALAKQTESVGGCGAAAGRRRTCVRAESKTKWILQPFVPPSSVAAATAAYSSSPVSVSSVSAHSVSALW